MSVRLIAALLTVAAGLVSGAMMRCGARRRQLVLYTMGGVTRMLTVLYAIWYVGSLPFGG